MKETINPQLAIRIIQDAFKNVYNAAGTPEFRKEQWFCMGVYSTLLRAGALDMDAYDRLCQLHDSITEHHYAMQPHQEAA